MMEEPTCPATPPLSTCPATPPRIASPKSSPSQWSETKTNKTDASSSPGSRPSSPENCAICLGSLTNKSFTNSCLHQFCFVCLLEWSKVKAECPLCKVAFNSIIHNVRSQDDYDQYHVKQTPRATTIWGTLPLRNFRYRTTVTYHEFSDWMAHRTYPQISSAVSVHEAIPTRYAPPRTLPRFRSTAGTSDFRRSVYRQDLWARLQPDVTGRYRECSPEFYRQNPAQLHRLIPFLNRELNVLLEDGSRCAYVMERILELLPQLSMRSSEFRALISSYIGTQHAAHFCHELRAYASSPFDIVGYDRSVQYVPSAVSNYTDEVNDISSPSLSNHSAQDSDSDNDIQVIDPSAEPTPSSNTAHSRSSSTSAAQPADRFSPQPGPSGLCTRSNSQSAAGHPTASASSVVEVSSGSSSEDESDEVQIVGYVKPRHERTPEIITLSSPEHPTSVNDVSLSPPFIMPSPDELICINLGSTSTVSHHLSWNDHLADVSSDEVFNSRGSTETGASCVESPKTKRKTRASRSDCSTHGWSTSSPSHDSSGEEWGCRSRKTSSRKSIKRQKTSKSSSKLKSRKSDSSSDSENEAHSSSSRHRSKKCGKLAHSSSKLSSKHSGSNERYLSSHGRSRNKRSESHHSSKSKKKFDPEGDGHATTSREKSKKSYSSRSKKHCNSDKYNSHGSSTHSSGPSSSPFKSPKLRSIVMTRTTHEGQESWSVTRNRDSPDRSQSQNEITRPSRLHSVVSVSSPSCYSPRNDKLSDVSPSSRNGHRRDSSSSSSKKKQNSRNSKSAWNCEVEKGKIKRRNRSRSRSREESCERSSKWKARNFSCAFDSESD